MRSNGLRKDEAHGIVLPDQDVVWGVGDLFDQILGVQFGQITE
jgi:hypothetical protein